MPLRDVDITEYVLGSLGAESVGVELSASDIALCKNDALRRYSRSNPLERRVAYVVPPQQINKYTLNVNSYSVKDVQIQSALQTIEALDSQNFNMFNNFMVMNSGYGSGSPKAEDYELTLQWREMTGRVFSLDPDFFIDDDPQPDGETEDVTDYQSKCIYIFNPTGLDVKASWVELAERPAEKVSPRDHDWILSWSLAHAKEILGRKRSKVQSIPMAGQQVKLDGEALLKEAREDKLALTDDLHNRFIGLPWAVWG